MTDNLRPSLLQLAARLERKGLSECEAIRFAKSALFPPPLDFHAPAQFWKIPKWPVPQVELNKEADFHAEKLEAHIRHEQKVIAALRSTADEL